jgi:hypothetical protein
MKFGEYDVNERIKLLAEQAYDTIEFNYAPSKEIFNKQKFAELIIDECVNILEKPEYAMTHSEELSGYNKGWVNGRLLGIEHIKEHFGVEE